LISGKVIFICALDWGLGHATRCVPLICDLKKNNQVIIGVTPLTGNIFDEEFPDLEKITLPAYNIKYSPVLPLWLKLLFDWPRISKIIKEENTLLEKIIADHKIDMVISDNRFGLYSKKIRSVFITHQLFLKTPFANSFAQKINKKYILNFDEIWIPDFEDEKKSLSGDLSHGNHFHKNVNYIGPQSRLQKITGREKKYDYLFLLSGPEPQQSIFKNMLIEKSKKYPDLKFVLAGTKQGTNTEHETNNLKIINGTNPLDLSEAIAQSQKIICRSGYSTLMDLYLLEKKDIILVPTPGQTEQEYLAKYWFENFGAKMIDQKDISGIIL